MINETTTKIVVLEYSLLQDEFHIQTLTESVLANRQIIKNNVNLDWLIIGVYESQASAFEAAERFAKELGKRTKYYDDLNREILEFIDQKEKRKTNPGELSKNSRFIPWLFDRKGKDDTVGDLIKDIKSQVKIDGSFPMFENHDEYLRYFTHRRACDGAIEAFNLAWKEFESVKN